MNPLEDQVPQEGQIDDAINGCAQEAQTATLASKSNLYVPQIVFDPLGQVEGEDARRARGRQGQWQTHLEAGPINLDAAVDDGVGLEV